MNDVHLVPITYYEPHVILVAETVAERVAKGLQGALQPVRHRLLTRLRQGYKDKYFEGKK